MKFISSADSFSPHTRRAYQLAIADFERIVGLEAQDATQQHFDTWVVSMQRRKLSTATIRQRISAISHANPVLEVALPKREFIEHTCMNADQLAAFLSTISLSPTGHIDFALIALATTYGLKNSQIRTLRWNQIIKRSNGSYAIHLANETIFLPDSFQILMKVLTKKTDGINPNDYIFMAMSKRCQNLPCVNSFENDKSISSSEFNRRAKKYARMARLDEKNFTVRTFRYTLEFLGQEQVIKIIEKVLKKRFPQPVPWKSLSHDPRLHGLGRRSR